ncbi:hypothetical protein COL154_013779 [Colletotrichum chrysophilum]|nr:hypothetical protein Brms1b_004430 [Colletotrichum noveboracense]KAJ0338181.1 hypothetical protein KNSL1_012530 [Colletotrichum chrysophilum]KAJ0348233.1 hypothetical protein COL154_013779 [Colletotrichum chrysophilum]
MLNLPIEYVRVCRAGPSNSSGALQGEAKLADANTIKGSSGYLKHLSNLGDIMNFASGCSSDAWEFLVLPGGKTYSLDAKKSGNSLGPIRVSYNEGLQFWGIEAEGTANGRGDPYYCALKPMSQGERKGKGKVRFEGRAQVNL